MTDNLSGWFIESCDCASLCPCWIDDEPDDNHCTGLFAWVVEEGAIGGHELAGARVVSVSTHSGRRSRPEGGRYSVVFVDTAELEDEKAFGVLEAAFTTPAGGVLSELAEVNGAVLAVRAAHVEVTGEPREEPRAGETWSVKVRPRPRARDTGGADGATDPWSIETGGELLVFDQVEGAKAVDPLTLTHTALDKELAVIGAGVQALTAHRFRVNLPSLPGGYVDSTNRSAMRGRFGYSRP